MNSYHILICDDSPVVHESLTRFLEAEGITVTSVYTGEDVLTSVRTLPLDLLILDVMLPGINGTDVCRQIRKTSNVPIIFLSARNEEIDRIISFELGGDDYVTKPFSPREVALRVKTLLKRSAPDKAVTEESHIFSFEELTVNEDEMRVYVNDDLVDMTAKEAKILIYMIHNKNKVLNREQILQAVWGYDYYGDTRVVDAAIKRIRKKLPDGDYNFAIQSIYGVGYRLGGSVS